MWQLDEVNGGHVEKYIRIESRPVGNDINDLTADFTDLSLTLFIRTICKLKCNKKKVKATIILIHNKKGPLICSLIIS